jgi:hypothetical protein
MDKAIEQKVTDYVYKNYSRAFAGKPLIIVEGDNHFRISSHKDASPLILGKSILNN